MVQNIYPFLPFQSAFKMKKEDKLLTSRDVYRDLYNKHRKTQWSTGE